MIPFVGDGTDQVSCTEFESVVPAVSEVGALGAAWVIQYILNVTTIFAITVQYRTFGHQRCEALKKKGTIRTVFIWRFLGQIHYEYPTARCRSSSLILQLKQPLHKKVLQGEMRSWTHSHSTEYTAGVQIESLNTRMLMCTKWSCARIITHMLIVITSSSTDRLGHRNARGTGRICRNSVGVGTVACVGRRPRYNQLRARRWSESERRDFSRCCTNGHWKIEYAILDFQYDSNSDM